MEQHPGQPEHLLLAPRERRGAVRSLAGQHREEVEHSLDPSSALDGIVAVRVGSHLEVLRDRHGRKDGLAPQKKVHAHGHAMLWRHVGDRPPVEADHAVRRGSEAGDHPEDRRLPRPVRVQQRQHLTLVHLEIHAEEDLDVAVGKVDVAHLEHRIPSALSSRRWCSSSSSLSSAVARARSVRIDDAPRMMNSPPRTVDGTSKTITAVRTPNSFVRNAEANAPPVAPMKKT